MLKRALSVNMHSLCTFILVQALLRPDVVSGGPPQQQLVLPAAPNLPGACVNVGRSISWVFTDFSQ